ncbi:MAG: hypothetical protein K6G33_01680 [Ruminococcus sp.]|nr:hypothetical protein [Ruminococcus sp.]
MNQEKLMKRKMIRAIILCLLTMVALAVFIALYIDETRRVQETYRRQYMTDLSHVIEDIDSYKNGKGDHSLRYMRIVNNMGSANSFAFLIESLDDEKKKTINEVNACVMKYPEQMKDKLDELRTALSDISEGLDKGYTEAADMVSSVDKMGK